MNSWIGTLWQAADSERKWALALAAGVLLLGGLTLGPALFPSPRVPTITRQVLPLVAAAPSAEPPVYPRTASVQPLISGRLNLNTASSEQLEALPKVGPSMAALIIAARPLRSIADLDAIKGVGESTLKALTPLVSF
ncbi:helix-hairpin-helix domain-containing protein [Deinococcus sp. QL22]|uniref:ComEA family DNA-binding protein n=1 Tax=Deinococcus sp. QL22 TaxID=2939437 RepID=UPI002017D8AA|nr:helix-hairpin-helix domain-containing protein [Deinococcus sp. QL22]UQN07140.1 helix-hairpin-helix domain-containing protein [Deinococcus sp. QL22]